jgi:DNA adenine methylase
MGFGSSGASKGSTGFRIDSGRHYGTASYLWNDYPKEIPVFCERFKGVLIESKPALDLIENHDREDTFFYLDPPYVLNTRSLGGNKFYRHEMTDEDHVQLLDKITLISGLVIISGYDNDMYNDFLSGWEKKQTKSRISSGRGTKVKTETIWISPGASYAQRQKSLFT